MSRIEISVVSVLGSTGAILAGYGIAEGVPWSRAVGFGLFIAAYTWLLRPRRPR